MSTEKKRVHACRECPWRKTSLPGWLGESSPVEFLQQSESGQYMPCHLTVNYEETGEKFDDEIMNSSPCNGRRIHFANRAKRLNIHEPVQSDDSIFMIPQHFIDHHSRGNGPTVMICGQRVVEMKNDN